jgi:hypothetical protein
VRLLVDPQLVFLAQELLRSLFSTGHPPQWRSDFNRRRLSLYDQLPAYRKGISFAAVGRIAMPKRINMPSPTTSSVQLAPMK